MNTSVRSVSRHLRSGALEQTNDPVTNVNTVCGEGGTALNCKAFTNVCQKRSAFHVDIDDIMDNGGACEQSHKNVVEFACIPEWELRLLETGARAKKFPKCSSCKQAEKRFDVDTGHPTAAAQ